MDRKFALGAAAGALFLLGTIYGWQAAHRIQRTCLVPDQFSGRVQSVFRLEGERAQYEVVSSEGCLVLVTTARFPEFRVGDVLEFSGEAEGIGEIPEEYAGYRDYLARRGVAATTRYPDIRLREGTNTANFLEGIRRILRREIGQAFPEPEASLIAAMVLGERGSLPEEIDTAFRRVGVSHILAISGFNVTLLAGILLGLFAPLPVSPRIRALIMAVVVWGYVALAGAPVSAQRAAWFWTLVLIAWQLHVLVGFFSVMVLALVGMVSLSPLVIYDVGWQLSLSAVLGIWLILFFAKNFWQGKRFRFMRALVLSSFGATLATWPIVAYHFGLISLVSLPANLIVVPLTSAFMAASLVALATHFIFPPVALGVSLGVHMIWKIMEGAVVWLAALPAAALADVSLPLWFLPLYYAALVALTAVLLRAQHRSWREVWE